jgi:hypothetical protein
MFNEEDIVEKRNPCLTVTSEGVIPAFNNESISVVSAITFINTCFSLPGHMITNESI